MRRKHSTSSVKWTDKNRIYLERLGFLDGRTGRKRKDENKSISKFINEVVTVVLENDMHTTRSIANSDELRVAWAKFNISALAKKIEWHHAQVDEFRKLLPHDIVHEVLVK